MFFAGMALGIVAGATFGIGIMCCVVAGKQEDQRISEIWKGWSGSPFWMGKVFA